MQALTMTTAKSRHDDQRLVFMPRMLQVIAAKQ